MQKKSKSVHLRHWEQSGLNFNNSHYEIVNNGILSAKDSAMVWSEDGSRFLIPLVGIENINVYSDVVISGKLLSLFKKMGITLTVFDRYGNCVGRFANSHNKSSSETFLNQAAFYIDKEKRLTTAKKFVDGEIFNMGSVLNSYSKSKLSQELNTSILELRKYYHMSAKSSSIEQLMLFETRAKSLYFSEFNEIISNSDFKWIKRTRRPPEDEINAMMSFGNSILYNIISNEIHKTSLDVKIGYLHATGNRAESLNLDIAEIFKPVIVDKTIFALINKKMIRADEHFVRSEKGVYLSKPGKELFLRQLYSRLADKKTYKGEKCNYRYLIWEDINNFKNYINGDEEYKPFHYEV